MGTRTEQAFAKVLQAAVALMAISTFGFLAYSRGWHAAAVYYQRTGWATGISICNASPDFCKRSKAEAEAILEEARRDL